MSDRSSMHTNPIVQFKKLSPRLGQDIPLPRYATEGAAGFDLAVILDAPLQIMPGDVHLLSTGLALYLASPNLAAMILPRSGLGHKHGIIMGNSVGLIDSDYQGELMISCWNRAQDCYTIQPGDRIAQLIIVPVVQAQMQWVDEFIITERGHGGFGHTGR